MFTRSQYTALLLAAFAATPILAGPSPDTSVITTPAVVVGKRVALSQTASDVKGFTVPVKKKRGTKKSLESRADTGNFNSTIVDNWLVVLSVGTPPQELELSLDLGSSGFVVESTLVEKDMQTTSHPIYNPNISTSGSEIDGYTWNVAYGGFSLKGAVFTDDVSLGENTWTNMTIEVVTAEPTGSPIETASGILGLAANLETGASPANVPSFLGAIKEQLSDAVFTLWFNATDLEEENNPDGTIDFGFIDETKYTDEIAYAPLYNNGGNTFWSLNVSGIGAADPRTGHLLYSNMTEFTAILDTGDGQSQLPLAALWGYYGAIPGSIYDDAGHTWDYDCSVNSSLPDLVLFIGDKPVVVPRDTYGWWQSMTPTNGKADVDYCTTHLRPSEYFNDGVPMIGQDIINGIFLVLDWQNQQMGLANSTVRASDSKFSIPTQT